MYNATLENQFGIQTANVIGAAGRLADVITHQANANIRTFWGNESGQNGQFFVITDDNAQVAEFLQQNGFDNLNQDEVLVIRVADHHGSCAQVAQQLADAGLNIEYLYTTIFDNHPALIVNTSDNQKAFQLFNSLS